MSSNKDILPAARAALRTESRIRPLGRIQLSLTDGDLMIEGEVDHIAAKKLAVEAVARIPGVVRIIDKLHVHPAVPMGDGEILEHVRDALVQEIVLASCLVRVRVKGRVEIVREPPRPHGDIEIGVENGVVTLDGAVSGPGEKRLAGVLAWWVPGCRDVVNGLSISPPEQDSEAAVTDAVLQVLEKDPFVDASSIHVFTRDATVTLTGTVPHSAELKLAEDDAWYVFGVARVMNQLEVT